jgi:hypothetical protein
MNLLNFFKSWVGFKGRDETPDREGYTCPHCARVFNTEYELLNHVHRPGDLLAVDNPETFEAPIQKSGTSPGTMGEPTYKPSTGGVMRYDKFPGKIGYIPKKKP